MDDIVFQRETLRRALAELEEKLAKAAESYDPEDDLPADDALAAVSASLELGEAVSRYTKAVTHRMKSRLERRQGPLG